MTTWIIVLTFYFWLTCWFLPFILLLHTYNLGKDCKYIFKKELCYLAELKAVQSCMWPVSKEFNKAPNSLNLPMELRNKNPIDLLIFKLLSSRGKNYWLPLEQEERDLWRTESPELVSPGLPQPRCSDKPHQMIFLAKQLKEKCIFVAFSSVLWNHKATCREKYFPRPVSAAIFPV